MAFFGIRVPSSIISTIPMVEMKERYPNLKWEFPADLHLTLRFFADGRGESMNRLMSETRVAEAFEPFTLQLGAAQVFDRRGRGGVLWLSILDTPQALKNLQLKLEHLSRDLGFPPEDRPYAPHITLARYEGRDKASIEQILKELSGFQSEPFVVSSFQLMKRTPGLDNAVYGDLMKVDGSL